MIAQEIKETKETKETKTTTTKGGRYIEAIGRRKTATARVRIVESKNEVYIVNHKTIEEYFPTREMRATVESALAEAELPTTFSVEARILGGGINAQSEAMRHGIARALVKFDESKRKTLKKAGFLKRDPRMKERKKPGLKKARKAAQWSKR